MSPTLGSTVTATELHIGDYLDWQAITWRVIALHELDPHILAIVQAGSEVIDITFARHEIIHVHGRK